MNQDPALLKYIAAAKAVIFDANRLEQLLSMIDTPEGALQAVQTVIGAIEQRKPVPPQTAPLLGMSIFLLLVDAAQELTGEAPDGALVQQVTGQIISQLRQAYKPKGAQP